MGVMRIGSLCSGAGGLDMAVEQVLGARTVFHCETDPAASRVLEYRYPGVPNYGDLKNVAWGIWRNHTVDILTAGWPCQPFSLAGKQKGADDERAIWPQIARAIFILRPGIIVLENVSAVLVSEFGRVANSLAALGYDLRWTCLRAGDVGAPHRRERLFVIAHAEGYGWHEGWSESAGLVGGSYAPVGSASAVDLLPTPTSRDHKGPNQRRDDTCLHGALLPTPSASDGTGGRQRSAAGLANPDRQTNLTDLPRLLLQTPSVADATGGHLTRSGVRRTEQLLPGQAAEMAIGWGKYGPAIARWGSLTRPAPSPTEPNTKGNPRLNPAFSEWLMGWPAGWVTDVPGISRNDQLRIIGNGVVPQCAAAALTWLLSLEVTA